MKRAILIIALAASPVFADEVYLKGGGRFSGEIVEQTAEEARVSVAAWVAPGASGPGAT